MPPELGAVDDYFSDLTTTPIFADEVYRTEVLNLPHNENEDDLDTQLALSAQESGIEDPFRYLLASTPDISTAMSTLTVSSEEPRSSMSIHSRESQSTGMTSYQSRTSKDNPYFRPQPFYRVQKPLPPLPRASLSLEYYDTVLERMGPIFRHRHSSSTASASGSVLSNTSSVPSKPVDRKNKRTSGLFGMFRRDSRSPHSMRRNPPLTAPASPRLDCGHRPSKHAIRFQLREARNSADFQTPQCCGKPVPRSFLETTLTPTEMADYDLATTLSPCSQRDSGYSEDGVTPPISPYASEVTDPQPADPFHTTTELPNRDVSQEQCITSALANEAFKTLRAQQKEEMRRVVVFERQQQRALEHFQQGTLKKSSEKLERDKAEKEEQHAADLEKLDEAHILAEHELRKSQATEVQNVATALKYMEAYCSGSNPVSPSTTHNVTEEDRKKLARQHQIQQNLPRKHESAVNVLRARQEKQLQVRMERQEAEMQKLETDFETAKTAAEWQLSQDISRLSTMSQARRKRCTNRWELKFEIWRRDWEAQHGKPLEGRLPGVQWDEVENEEQELLDEEIRSSSSLAVFFEL